MSTSADVRALLLDIGGVVIRTPFELLARAEERFGLADGALGPRGPFDLDHDPEFRQVRDGSLAERAYWARRAERAAPLLDVAADTRSFMQVLYDLAEDDVVRPAVRRLIDDAHGADVPVGMLTNDLVDFHGQAWVDRMTIFASVDVLVDGSVTGALKPDPVAFTHAVAAMDLPPEQLLLVDDQPVNVAGARAAGLHALELDVTRPDDAVAAARRLLGL